MRWRLFFGVLLSTLLISSNAQAQTFFDDFNNGARPEWGNEIGAWTTFAGEYLAQTPSAGSYTSLTPYAHLTDFTIDVDLPNLSNTGIWLRSADNLNGVMLVTAGNGGSFDGLYWHTFSAGSILGTFGAAEGLGIIGQDVHLRVEVAGNSYQAFVNHSPTPASFFETADYPFGSVALTSAAGQTFDNFSLNSAPEPISSILFLTGAGVLSVPRLRRRLKKS